jgi:uncharacterized protein YlaI
MSAQVKIVSPFAVLRKNKTTDFVDPSLMKIEHSTPLPSRRFIAGKYSSLFMQLKLGSCIVCERHEKDCVSNALRKWIKNKALEWKIVSFMCDDGHARVWVVKANP